MTSDGGGREAILERAAKLFSRKGYTGVSIRDIAQACGITNAALYYHFKNKDDLYLAVLRHHHEAILQSIAGPDVDGGDLGERLKQLVVRYAEVMCSQRQSFQSVRRDLSHVDDARAHKLLSAMHADFMQPLRRLIEAAQAEGEIAGVDPRLLARLLHGMIIALTFEGGTRRPRLTAGEADVLVDVFLHGVGRVKRRT
jgi:AcrR family transcriptional regulator